MGIGKAPSLGAADTDVTPVKKEFKEYDEQYLCLNSVKEYVFFFPKSNVKTKYQANIAYISLSSFKAFISQKK